MPAPVKVAAILLGVLAALLLTNSILSFAGIEAILDQFAEAAQTGERDFDRDAVRSQLTLNFAVGIVIGLVAAAAVVLLVQRRPLGRWLGLGSAAIELLITVLFVFAVGGILIYSLLFIVLTVATIVMLFRRPALEWLHAPSTT